MVWEHNVNAYYFTVHKIINPGVEIPGNLLILGATPETGSDWFAKVNFFHFCKWQRITYTEINIVLFYNGSFSADLNVVSNFMQTGPMLHGHSSM